MFIHVYHKLHNMSTKMVSMELLLSAARRESLGSKEFRKSMKSGIGESQRRYHTRDIKLPNEDTQQVDLKFL